MGRWVELGALPPDPQDLALWCQDGSGLGERMGLAPDRSRPRGRRSGRIPAEPCPPPRPLPSLLPPGSGHQGEREDLIPLALQGGDGTQLRQGDGYAVAPGQMRAEEVVGGDEHRVVRATAPLRVAKPQAGRTWYL